MKIKVGFIVLIVVFLVSLFGKSHSLTLKEISKIQPGLGTIMVEFGHRFTILYYGAKSLNWELAKYELDEMVEAQEVAIITRPEYKQQLESMYEETRKQLMIEFQDRDRQLRQYKEELERYHESLRQRARALDDLEKKLNERENKINKYLSKIKHLENYS